MNKNVTTGEIPIEMRGGDHKNHLYTEVRKSVYDFIGSLKCTEPHYCRSNSSVRKYLPSELTKNKLYKMYQEKYLNRQGAKQGLFKKHFNTEYNLGFGTPRTDICSICLQFQENIKTETDSVKKKDLMIQKRIHTLNAKAFYSILKTKEDGSKTMSFDCQNN